MPEHASQPAAPAGGVAGGYPPMRPLVGAVPGWPEGRTLTSASTPEAARAVLRAEAETSVLHPTGLRWRVVRRMGQVVQLAAWVWLLVVLVGTVLVGDGTGLAMAPVMALLAASLLTGLVPWARLRADPTPQSLPSSRRERLRLSLAAVRGELVVTPGASWPPGSEAFALLSTASATDGIDGAWLLDRTALPAQVGARWLDALTGSGWLDGGRTLLGGRVRRPWRITDDGRDRLAEERARLQSLAAARSA